LIVNTQREQMNDLSQQVKETEAARIRDQEEMKEQVELSAKLDLLLGQGTPGYTVPNNNVALAWAL
jgi:hypothetical protein